MADLDDDHRQVLGALAGRGVLSSRNLQEVTGRSQATISRVLADLNGQVLALGRARATMYGLPKSIHGQPGQQPIYWTDEAGEAQRIGHLSYLSGDVVHVDSPLVNSTTRGALPWYLTPLRAQGFLGRLLAQRLAINGVADNPERWPLETQLFAALHLHDGIGAISLGEPQATPPAPELPADPAALHAALDALAADVARTHPAGSSAGGEQPKFLARQQGGAPVLVKFSLPRGTPFGERWHELLHAECLASQVLAQHGVAVAATRIVETARHTYLLSERFDRIGPRGRRHLVALGAAHEAFVPGAYPGWGGAARALAQQRRLSADDALRAEALLHFGRLIGNSDMHSGNLSLWVSAGDLGRGRFSLAPVYDMLPMRWKPEPLLSGYLAGARDYLPWEPDAVSLSSGALAPALAFWRALAELKAVGRDLRGVAAQMADRFAQRLAERAS